MTVTQRRVRTEPGKSDAPLAAEPGIKYTCDAYITHTVRIKCAAKECEEVDLCPSCFCEGKEVQRHKAWHDYKVVEQHSQPIFSPDWGADEELLLISGLILNGLGNWAEAATHIGTRTKEECQAHYEKVFLGVGEESSTSDAEEMDVDGVEKKRKREFMPPMHDTYPYDPDEFQAKKKARIEEMRKPQALPSGSNNPLVSAPTNHEVGGFMPGRLEFEHELDNEAEMVVKDFEFGLVHKYGGDEQPEAVITRSAGDDDDDEQDDDDDEKDAEVKTEDVEVKQEPGESDVSGGRKDSVSPKKESNGKGKEKAEPGFDVEDEEELEVKLALLDIYFSKLDKREEAKDLIFERGLTEYKKIQAIERKRPKDEKDIVSRYRTFAKLQTAMDYEQLLEGLIHEHNLRKRIAELQEFRRMGITTAHEAEQYDHARATRAGYRPIVARERSEVIPSGARVNAGQHRFLHGTAATPSAKGDSREPTPRVVSNNNGRRPVAPLNLANAASLDLLSNEERSLCASLRVLPKPYLTIKEMYIRENERRKGLLKRRDARKMLKIDVNKSGRIFDFLVSAGMLLLSYDPLVKHVPFPVKEVNGSYGDHHPNGTGAPGAGHVNGHGHGHGSGGGMNGHHGHAGLGSLVNGHA